MNLRQAIFEKCGNDWEQAQSIIDKLSSELNFNSNQFIDYLRGNEPNYPKSIKEKVCSYLDIDLKPFKNQL